VNNGDNRVPVSDDAGLLARSLEEQDGYAPWIGFIPRLAGPDLHRQDDWGWIGENRGGFSPLTLANRSAGALLEFGPQTAADP
jgi:hypothetical protein